MKIPKNTVHGFCLILLGIAFAALCLTTCSPGWDDNTTLNGRLVITTDSRYLPAELIAKYTGIETINYWCWRKDGLIVQEVGDGLPDQENGDKYTATSPGLYTVTVDAESKGLTKYYPKTSDEFNLGNYRYRQLEGQLTVSTSGAPFATISPLNNPCTLTAHYSGTEDVTYTWSKAGDPSVSSKGPVYRPITEGSYTVRIWLSNLYEEQTSDPITVPPAPNVFRTWESQDKTEQLIISVDTLTIQKGSDKYVMRIDTWEGTIITSNNFELTVFGEVTASTGATYNSLPALDGGIGLLPSGVNSQSILRLFWVSSQYNYPVVFYAPFSF